MSLFKNARAKLGLTQAEMAVAVGLSMRQYQELEADESKVRPIHMRALSWAMLKRAAETGNPMMATDEGRAFALTIVRRLFPSLVGEGKM